MSPVTMTALERLFTTPSIRNLVNRSVAILEGQQRVDKHAGSGTVVRVQRRDGDVSVRTPDKGGNVELDLLL